jgi:hypothetical protein
MRVNTLLQSRALCRRANHLAQVLLRVGFPTAETDKEQITGLAAALAQVLGQQAHTWRGNVRITILLRLRGLDMQCLTA